MPRWKDFMRRVLNDVESQFDRLSNALNDRLYSDDDVQILPYIGYGTHQHIHMTGRVLRRYDVTPAKDADSVWRNLLNIYRRFATQEIPRAVLQYHVAGTEGDIVCDDDGFFQLDLDLTIPPDVVWQTVQLTYAPDDDATTQTNARVFIPPPDAAFGVISDIDDTVIQSEVTHLLKLVRNTFLKNARTRLPFAGVAAFYQALQRGTGQTTNPIFYVSNSPWNLYDLLTDFFAVRGIPLGPIFLRDIGMTREYFIVDDSHKEARIAELLALYPRLSFILIGDSGEKDAEIYLQIAQNHPERIQAIYIRDVYPDTMNQYDEKVQALVKSAREAGTEMILVKDTHVAAQHAIDKGFIMADWMEDVEAQINVDTGIGTKIPVINEDE